MHRIRTSVAFLVLLSACGPGIPGEVIAEGEKYAQGLSQDEGSLYWFGRSNVYRVGKDGGDIRTLAEGQNPVTMVGVGGRACWVNQGAVYQISCVSADGGEVAVLDEEPIEPAIVRNLATDGESLYWSNSNGEIRRVPLAGGSEAVTFAAVDTSAASIAVTADAVLSSAMGGIARFEKATGEGRLIVGGAVVVPRGLALGRGSDPNVYWVEMSVASNDAFILSANQQGSEAAILAQNQVLPSDLAVGPRFVYWGTGYADAHIRRAGIDVGTAVEDFAEGTRISGAPVVDDTYVYWLDFDGKIHKAEQ